MMAYAENTTVTTDRSLSEIERLLEKYGATSFSYSNWGVGLTIMFHMRDRVVRLNMPLPALADFHATPTGRARSASAAKVEHEKARRQKWRALLLIVKAKLESVESGIVSFEQEWLAHIVLPSGATVFEETEDQIRLAYLGGADQKGRPLQIGA